MSLRIDTIMGQHVDSWIMLPAQQQSNTSNSDHTERRKANSIPANLRPKSNVEIQLESQDSALSLPADLRKSANLLFKHQQDKCTFSVNQRDNTKPQINSGHDYLTPKGNQRANIELQINGGHGDLVSNANQRANIELQINGGHGDLVSNANQRANIELQINDGHGDLVSNSNQRANNKPQINDGQDDLVSNSNQRANNKPQINDGQDDLVSNSNQRANNKPQINDGQDDLVLDATLASVADHRASTGPPIQGQRQCENPIGRVNVRSNVETQTDNRFDILHDIRLSVKKLEQRFDMTIYHLRMLSSELKSKQNKMETKIDDIAIDMKEILKLNKEMFEHLEDEAEIVSLEYDADLLDDANTNVWYDAVETPEEPLGIDRVSGEHSKNKTDRVKELPTKNHYKARHAGVISDKNKDLVLIESKIHRKRIRKAKHDKFDDNHLHDNKADAVCDENQNKASEGNESKDIRAENQGDMKVDKMQRTGVQVVGHGASNFKTGTLQQTENYRWNTADALGKGATAVVYFGRHKDSGDVCAVKVFHDRSNRPSRQREIDTLRSLNHANIVRLINLELESATGNEVLVMEYCSGGSLYSMLEQPQYGFGFPESEFLLFLKHIAEGMRYLRNQGYVHRDIKPGNIMRYIAEDGRSLYKLTDFGAARELQDDETFMSIYGTEEYLYPKMYEQAVLRRPGMQVFDSSVDLWSLGVTLYHVATGQLPFLPFGGRSNAATMHMITSEKPSGVISGVQKTMNGSIQWSSSLPDTCMLSEYVKLRLVSMLAGLLEMNTQRMWTFEKFYDTVINLDNRIVMKIFSCCTSQLLLLYVEPTDTYVNIQERIAAATELPAAYQLILWHDKQLCDVVQTSLPVKSYPNPVIKSKLFLFNKNSMENCDVKIVKLVNFPTIVPEREQLDLDASTSKKATIVAYRLCLLIQIYLQQQKLVVKGEVLFRRYIKNIVWNAEWIVPEIRHRLNETKMHMDSFTKTFSLLLKLFDTLDSISHVEEVVSNKVGTGVHLKETMDQLTMCLKDQALKQFFDKIQTRLNEISVYVEVLSRRITEQETERLRHVIGCAEDDHCSSKAEMLKQKISNISSTMVKHKKYGDLHSHEHFIHKCEKQKLEEYCMTMTSLTNEHCKRNLQSCVRSTVHELGNLTKHLTRTRKVEQNISTVKESLSQLTDRLSQKEERCQGIVERITEILASVAAKGKQARQIPGAQSVPNLYTEGIRSELRSDLQQHETMARPVSEFSTRDTGSTPKRQRTDLLDRLTQELMSLKTDSDELKHLVVESGEVMKQFLCETSNLRIEGSLDSDQRRYAPDDT